MSTKSNKLYKDSPEIQKDDDGKAKVGIKKPDQADAENMGVAGDNADGDPSEMPIEVKQMSDAQKRHAVETKDMHKRHEDETADMHKRHLKEISKVLSKKEESDGQ